MSSLARLAHFQRDYPLLQVVALVAAFVWGATTISGFSSQLSIYSMLVLASLLGFAAVGQTLTVLVGGLDVSAPSWLLAGALVTVELHRRGWPFPTIMLILFGCAIVVGGLAGLVCFRFRIDSVIVTLATGSIVIGGTYVWSGGYVSGSPPRWLQRLTSPASDTLGLDFPQLPVFWAAVGILLGVVLHRTVVGRWIFATGSNPRAAALALVPTTAVWVGAFALSAVFSVVAGVLLAGFAGAGDRTAADLYLWQALAAVIVGGTSFGARGDYTRTMLGALFLTVLTTAMIGHGLGYADQTIMFGVIIFVVVGLYGRERRVRDRV